jgi:hypothetical protein
MTFGNVLIATHNLRLDFANDSHAQALTQTQAH